MNRPQCLRLDGSSCQTTHSDNYIAELLAKGSRKKDRKDEKHLLMLMNHVLISNTEVLYV